MFTSVLKNKDLQSTIIVAVGSIIGSFFAYLLQFFLGRMLSIEDYGTFGALLSLSTIIGVFTSILVIASVKIIASLKAREEHRKISYLFKDLSIKGALLGIIIFLILSILRFFIATELKISNANVIIFFSIFFTVAILPNISRAFFQGLLRYTQLASYTIYSGFLRFIVPVLFVYLGYGLSGVFSGMALGLFISYIISIFILSKSFVKPEKVSLKEEYTTLLKLGLPVALINLGSLGMNNIDMLLVKKFFDPVTAGYYAGTVTIGKILLFGAGAVTMVMYPKVSAAHSRNENYKKVADNLFLIQSVLVILGVAFFSIFPGPLTRLFFGERFITSIQYLPRFSMYIGVYVLINAFVMYFLAIDKNKVSLVLIPSVISQYILISLFHNNIYSIININILVTTVVLISLYILYNKT